MSRQITQRERILDWIVGNLPWLVGAVVIAGIVHIASVLVMPRLAPKDAYARLEKLAPLHRMTLLPATAPGAGAPPFEDPALVQGVCRYDLALGPLRLRAELPPDALTLMSFHARFGEIYYSMTDRSATRGKLDVLLVTPEQLEAAEANDAEDELPQDLRILAPTLQGFILIRALAERSGDFADAQKRVLSIGCSVESSSNP